MEGILTHLECLQFSQNDILGESKYATIKNQ